MKIIPLNKFCSFRTLVNDEILLFNKEIKTKLKNNNNLKKNQTILNLYLNKVNNDNYFNQCKKFISTNYIQKDSFDNLTLEFYKKLILEGSFTESYLLFYKTIIENYYNESKYDFSYLVNLVESKFLMDFENKKVLLESFIKNLIDIPKDLNESEIKNYHNTHKLNNIKLIFYMIKSGILSDSLISNIYKTLSLDGNEDFLYEFLKLTKDENYISTMDLNNLSLRFKTLFIELKKELQDTNQDAEKTRISKPKISNKILITNIIEEYLFIDEIDEVKTFIENYILKKNLQIKFVETVLLYGKQNDKQKEMETLLEQVKDVLKKKPVILQENL